MRPTRLDLEGFASFRQPTTLDFDDADLFVLSGPTGSGKCLPGDTIVYEGATGRRLSLREAVEQRVSSVLGFTAGRVASVPVVDWHSNGERETVRLTTEDARSLIAAETHPILTDQGLVEAGTVRPGDWVAHAAHLGTSPPAILHPHEALLLGLLLGDGSIPAGSSPKFSNTDPDILALFGQLVHRRWPNAIIRRHGRSITHGVSNPKGARRQDISRGLVTSLEAMGADLRQYLHPGNLAQTRRGERAIPLAVIEQVASDLGRDLEDLVDRLYPAQGMCRWLNSLGVDRTTTRHKCVPDGVVLQGGQVAVSLLSGLILTDGWCSVTRDEQRAQIGFSSASERLAHDFRTIAASCELATSLSVKSIGGRQYWSVALDVDATRMAGPQLRLVGAKSRARDHVLDVLASRHWKVSRDRVPPSFNRTLTSHGRYGPARLETQSLSRDTFLELGGDPEIAKAETRWVKVRSVEPSGPRSCYDLTVGTPEHLYLADTWIVHNSSLIDAMTFSLFGVVARYGDKRLVAPVISNGRNEARVRLLFRVGEVGYTAVRVVRRTANGASTKEARLERWRGDDPDDAVVLAATADELTEAVESILGLGYEHFTTTVVLPQGAFQRFLHAKSSERQGLLVKLLDLEVFGNIGKAARTRASTLDAQATLLAQQLDAAAADVTDQVIADADARVEALTGAVATIDDARPELDEILDEGRDMARRVQDLTAQRDALAAVEAPADLEELAGRLVEATSAAAAAAAAQVEARTRRRDLDEAVDDLPSADAVTAQRRRVERRAALAEETATAIEDARAAAEAVTATTAAVESAQQTVDRAGADLERAREANLVAALAADLQPGDPCPVCKRPLADEVEVHDQVLDHARAAVRQADAGLAEARTAAAAAADGASRGQERQRQVAAQVERLGEDLAAVDLPVDPGELTALATRVAEAARRRRAARTAESEADQAVTTAQRGVQAAQQGLESARTALDTTRDRLSALQPPSLDRDEPAAAWDALLAWVQDQRPAAAERLATAEQATAAARETYSRRMAALKEGLGDQPVDMAGLNMAGPLRDAFVDAHATVRGRHQRLVQLRDDNRKRQQELADVRRRGAVATELGRLLARNNFEQWLLARAVNRLVAGASLHLRALTRDAYTLRLEPDGSFGIVDHANGGEVRSARTLSGGETFLASLSLALALSDHVADFAADGAARLESLFIDEGFGTLDPGTVDVVRTALEELGSTGRMVGVVTHVQALAEQLPVQFHVRKESQSSIVERVDA